MPKPERQTSAGDSAGQADNEAEIFKLLDGLSQPPPAARPAEAAPGPAIKPPAQSAPQPDRTAEPAAKPPQSGGDFMSILESIMDE
ncbi:MAG: hypothetical protein LBS90_07780 [Oscillospiraceae bacterium]|nr:hypothetical protein [Oscillospiraceae bacterium]